MADQRISEILWDQLSITEKIKSETEVISTPKKKEGRKLILDSQKQRESPGKPGSKRYNRFLNTQYLKEGGIFKGKLQVEYDYNLVDQKETLLFQDNSDTWEPYVSITYDRQQQKVAPFLEKEEDRRRQQRKNSRLNQSFALLRKDLREAFKQPFVKNSYFITEAEQRMVTFINDPLLQSIEVALDMPFQRLLLHGLGSYYSLLTSSYTNEHGKRITVVRKPKILPPMPEMSITEYIAQEHLKNKTPKTKKSKSFNNTTRSRSRSNSKI